MANIMKIKARVLNGMTAVKLTVAHGMEDGQRKDKATGERVAAKFLREIRVMYAGNTVFAANLSASIAKNPFFAFSFSGGAEGESLTINWVENTGKSGSETAKIG